MGRAAAALLLLLALATGGCDPAARQAPANPLPSAASSGDPIRLGGGVFRHAIEEPASIVPPSGATEDDWFVIDSLFDSLTGTDVGGRAVPSAAESWDVSESARNWVFTLREGATFHDGTPVTAEAFVVAWATLAREGTMSHLLRDVVGYPAVQRGDVDRLVGVRALSPTVLQVTLVRPRADFAIVAGHPALGPVPPESFLADRAAYDQQPIGNGPFRMDEPWAHGEFIRVGQFDGWANGVRPEGAIAEVVYRIADMDTNFLAFRQGRRDFAAVPPEALPMAAEEHPPEGGEYLGPGLIVGGTPSTYLFAINRRVEPYTDLQVREAVSLMLDRDRIAAENEGGNLDVATSLLPPALSRPSVGICELCTYNPSGAAARLDASGVRLLTLEFNAGGGHERIRDVLRDSLQMEGFGLVSNRRGAAQEFADYVARLEQGAVGMYRYTLTAEVASSLEVLYPLLHSGQTPERGGLNYLRYANAQVDALLDQAARTVDDDRREGLLRRVEDLVVNRDHVLIPVITYRHAHVVADDVAGLRLDPFGRVNTHQLRLL